MIYSRLNERLNKVLIKQAATNSQNQTQSFGNNSSMGGQDWDSPAWQAADNAVNRSGQVTMPSYQQAASVNNYAAYAQPNNSSQMQPTTLEYAQPVPEWQSANNTPATQATYDQLEQNKRRQAYGQWAAKNQDSDYGYNYWYEQQYGESAPGYDSGMRTDEFYGSPAYTAAKQKEQDRQDYMRQSMYNTDGSLKSLEQVEQEETARYNYLEAKRKGEERAKRVANRTAQNDQPEAYNYEEEQRIREEENVPPLVRQRRQEHEQRLASGRARRQAKQEARIAAGKQRRAEREALQAQARQSRSTRSVARGTQRPRRATRKVVARRPRRVRSNRV